MVWHKQFPLKVSIVTWRLLKDRLPTKINLQRRGSLQASTNTCVSGCGMAESSSHLFLHCDVFSSLWHHIRSWIGIYGADPQNISDHFYQFIHYSGYSKARRSFLQLIWLLCVWLVWNERNNMLFNNIETSIDQLLEKAKFHSLWWLKAHNTFFVYGSQRWWSDPLFYLSIDWSTYLYILCMTAWSRGGSLGTPCTRSVSPPLLIYLILISSKKKLGHTPISIFPIYKFNSLLEFWLS